jgi:hypothetical protein
MHSYQDSVNSMNLNMKGEKLISSEAEYIVNLAVKRLVKSIVLKNCLVGSNSLQLILSAILWASDVRCLALHNCRLNSDVLLSAYESSFSSVTGSDTSMKESTIASKNGNKNRKSCINDQLTLLDVSFNSLDTHSFKSLAAIVKKCTKLETLALDGNKMSVKEVQIILDAVRNHPCITQLSFSDCGLTDECMEFISFGIKMNRYDRPSIILCCCRCHENTVDFRLSLVSLLPNGLVALFSDNINSFE